MRPPSLWKADKQQSAAAAFAGAATAAAAPGAAPVPGATSPPAAPERAAAVVPVMLANGQQVLAQPWHGARAMMPGAPAMLQPCYQAVPLPGPSAAELLQGSFTESDLPLVPKPEPRRSQPPAATHPRTASRQGAQLPLAKASTSQQLSPSSSLPPLPPLAHIAPPASAGAAPPQPHRSPSPRAGAQPPHRSIVMQVSASLAKSRPADGLGTAAVLMPMEDSAMAAEDDPLGDDFARAAAAIGTDSDDDDAAAAAAAATTAAADAGLASAALRDPMNVDQDPPPMQRSATAPPPGESAALAGRVDVSARCASLGPGPDAPSRVESERDSGIAACQF